MSKINLSFWFFFWRVLKCEVSILKIPERNKISDIKYIINDDINLNGYNICNFKNACFSNNKTFIYVTKYANDYNNEIKHCCGNSTKCVNFDSRICLCATKRSEIEFVNYSDKKLFFNTTTWMINFWNTRTKYINPAHFAMKIVSTAVILNLAKSLPSFFDSMYFQDINEKTLSDFEKSFLDLLSKSVIKTGPTIFAKTNQFMCIKSTYTSQILQKFALKQEHLSFFRDSAAKKFNITLKPNYKMVKALILLRNNGMGLRRFQNIKQMEYVLKKYKIVYEKKIISSENSTLIQAKTFNSYSIIISPHSSQLVNLLFCRLKTVLILVTPYLVDNCFTDLASMCGLQLIKSVGHNYFNPKTKLIVPRINIGNEFISRTKHWHIGTYGNDIFVNISLFEQNIVQALALMKV